MAGYNGINADEIRQVQEFVRREFNALIRPAQGPLYHYTDGASAVTILDDTTLRATNILYADEGREMDHAFENFDRAIGQFSSAGGRRRELGGIILRYLSEVGHYVPPDIWTVSLSTIADCPEQWRRLESAGHGIALGFTAAAITRAAESTGALLAPCLYDDDIKLAIVGRGLALLETLYERRLKRAGAEPVEALVRYVVREMALFGSLMKRADAPTEQEWRMVLCNPSQTPLGARRIKAVARHDHTALYIDLDVADATGRTPVNEIVIGPSPRQQMTERAFRTLLYKHGYERARVLTAAG